jgi:sortase A
MRIVTLLERAAWIAGIAALAVYVGARADGEMKRSAGVRRFEQRPETPDQSLWSSSRQRAYDMSLSAQTGPVLAVLRIPAVDLEVPVYADTSTLHLNRGVGLIERTQAPGRGGNVGIAGHRDGFFRVLQHVKAGDRVEVDTQDRRFDYRVAFISLVLPTDARLLAPTSDSVVTLVTCFPFYFVGPAPRRFVVRAVLADEAADNQPFVRDELQELTATVETVDREKRTLVVVSALGTRESFVVSPEVRDFGRIRAGDRVTVGFFTGLALQINPADTGAKGLPQQLVTSQSQPDERPAIAVGRSITATVRIQSVDVSSHTVEFTRPDGITRIVAVENPQARRFLPQLQPGQVVEITYTEAVAMVLERAAD